MSANSKCRCCWRSRLTVNSRAKVSSHVDSSPLTHGLNETTTDGSVQVGSSVDKVHDVGGQVLSLPLDLGLHLGELLLDNFDSGSSATVESDHGSLGLFMSTLLGEPSRREGEQEHSADLSVMRAQGEEGSSQKEGNGGNDLDSKGDSPLSIGVEETTTVTDPVGNKESPS